jgi:hypothetical protein
MVLGLGVRQRRSAVWRPTGVRVGRMSRSVNIPNLGATRARPLGRGSLLRATEVAGSRLQGSRAPEGARSSSHMQMDGNAQGAPKGVRTAVSGAPKFGQKKNVKKGVREVASYSTVFPCLFGSVV